MMKKLLWLALIVPFGVSAESTCNEGLDECKFTSRITFEIIDSSDDSVVDRTQYERLIGVSYPEAMALKYIGMQGIIEGGVETFIRVLEAQGDAVKALSEGETE